MDNLFKRLSHYPFNPKSNPRENQMTEMLAYVLSLERSLKNGFIELATNGHFVKSGLRDAKIETQVQRVIDTSLLINYTPSDGKTAEKKYGYPDLAINGRDFILLFEIKLGAGIGYDDELDMSQISKYLQILDNEPYNKNANRLILIDFQEKIDKLDVETEKSNYPELYEMFGVLSWDEVSDYFYNYANDRNTEEPVTTILKQFNDFLYEDIGMGGFRGVPEFDKDNPYTPEKGKRALSALVTEVVKLLDGSELGIELEYKGVRGGHSEDAAPWVPLVVKGTEDHTKVPHLNSLLDKNHIYAALIIPDKVESKYRNNLINLIQNKDKFFSLVNPIREEVPELWFGFVHRHAYAGQTLTYDGTAEFKIDCIPGFDKQWESNAFKQTGVWWNLLKGYEDIHNHANIEVSFAVHYHTTKTTARKNRDKYKPYEIDPNDKEFPKELYRCIKALMPLFREIYGSVAPTGQTLKVCPYETVKSERRG